MARTPKPKAKAEPKPRGRPTTYTDEIALDICSRIAAGETLIEVCAQPGYPGETTVRGWDLSDGSGLAKDKPWFGFSAMYTRARLMQIEHEVDEIRIISNTPLIGEVKTKKQVPGKDGTLVEVIEVRTEDMLGHRKLQIDARKWRASKIAAHKYGDRGARDGVGNDDDGEIFVTGGLPEED